MQGDEKTTKLQQKDRKQLHEMSNNHKEIQHA